MTAKGRPLIVLATVLSVLIALLPACSSSAPAAAPTAAPAPAAAAPAAPTAAPAAPVAPTAAAPAAPTAAPAAPTAAPAAKVYEYNIAGMADFSGPTAESGKPVDPARKAVIAWWNDTRGKELGIKLNLKTFDSRYDASVAASLWPGILTSDKPIALLLGGGADITALAERLASDKVLGITGSNANGFNWKPNQWVFYSLPTYVHELVGFTNWTLANWKESRPMRISQIYGENSASHKDSIDGFQNAINKGVLGNKVEYVGAEALSLAATDASNQVKRILDKKADYFSLLQAVGPAVAVFRALQQYKNTDTKVVVFGTAGVNTIAQGIPIKELEGVYETFARASDAETDIEAYKIFQQYKDRVGAGEIKWLAQTGQGMLNTLPVLRSIERAAKSVGPDKITAQAVYDGMFAGPFTSKDLLGLAPDIAFAKDSPFPASNVKVRISIVKDGKLQPATADWISVPAVPKW